jgi:hypothetical protein
MDERANLLNARLVFGVALVALGALWTLDNLELMNAHAVLRWWPLVLVAYGLMKLTGLGTFRSVLSGVCFTAFGALLLAGSLGYARVGFDVIWSLFLIVIGTNVVLRAARSRSPGTETDASDWIRSFALMSGVSRRSQSRSLRRADLTAVMGGIELDLVDAAPTDGRVVADVFAWWGGVEIVVPEHWRVESDVTPIMGAFQDETRFVERPGATPTLEVRGLVVMGGVNVRNPGMPRRVRVGVVTPDERGKAFVGVAIGGVRTGRDEPADEKH